MRLRLTLRKDVGLDLNKSYDYQLEQDLGVRPDL